MIFLIYIAFIFLLTFTLAPKAYAYLDPGAGSYFLQILLAALVGSIFTIKMFWRSIKNFFMKPFRRHEKRTDEKHQNNS